MAANTIASEESSIKAAGPAEKTDNDKDIKPTEVKATEVKADKETVGNVVKSAAHVGSAAAIVGGYMGAPFGPVGAVVGAAVSAVVVGGAAGLLAAIGLFGKRERAYLLQLAKQRKEQEQQERDLISLGSGKPRQQIKYTEGEKEKEE